jgi:hypothetical protein
MTEPAYQLRVETGRGYKTVGARSRAAAEREARRLVVSGERRHVTVLADGRALVSVARVEKTIETWTDETGGGWKLRSREEAR